MKILTSPLPSLAELVGKQNKTNGYWEEVIWTRSSGISIRLIVEELIKRSPDKLINILVPNYFCGETEEIFDVERVQIIHYPITDELDPDWDKIKQDFKNTIIDVFLFVHYFGVYHDPNRAKTFCKQHGALLIEDAAHCLYKYQKIGCTGDFAIFSCHKTLPVPDGAVIIANSSENDIVASIYDRIQERVNGENGTRAIGWRIKKGLQKVINKNKPYVYNRKVHYYTELESKDNTFTINFQISKYSKNIIRSYSEEKLKQIAYVRRENADLLEHFVKSIDNSVISMIPNNCESPYFSVFSLERVKNKDEMIRRILEAGIPVMYWPELPSSIKNDAYSEIAEKLSKNIIAIPVHQGIKPEKLAKQLISSVHIGLEAQDIQVRKISPDQKLRWETLFKSIRLTNITQNWAYGDVKKTADNWDIERYIITQDGKDIGLLQLLSKKILGRKIVYRVNKGPIIAHEGNHIDLELAIMKKLWKEIAHPCIFFYVPFSFMSPGNFIKTVNSGWRNWDIFGFPTGIVDLSRTEEDIRKSLNSKWRNQLKTSEKYGYEIKTDGNRFDEMIRLYESEQIEKEFKGVSTNMLRAMSEHKDTPLRFFYVENEKRELIAFDIFYKHGQTATYYVGWNSIEGRKQYLNNLLLYHAAIMLKEEGASILDLGGIEYIYTEAVAKFKDGMMPEHFRQMGEFVRIG